jgi:hypothetical protein
VALPFQAAAGSEDLMAAIAILRELDAGQRDKVKPQDPHGFVPAAWRPFLAENGKLDRRIWEISFAIRDALRASNLFLAESRVHVSFWNLVYDDRRWQETRGEAYGRLDLSAEPHVFLDKLTAALDRAARAAARGLPGNSFATVRDGKLKLKQRCRSRRRCAGCARPSKQACHACGSKTCCKMSMNGAALPAPFNRSAATSLARETRIARCSPPSLPTAPISAWPP